MKTKLSDGYWVENSETSPCVIAWGIGSKKFTARATSLKPVPSGSEAESIIKKAGKNPADYLVDLQFKSSIRFTAETAKIIEIGVAACVAQNEKVRLENEARQVKIAAEREAARAKCSFSDALECSVEWFDGAPNRATCNGVEIPLALVESFDSSSHRWAFNFASAAVVEKLVEAKTAADKITNEEKAAQEGKAAAIRAAQLLEARSTGQPVVIAKWVTDRCMSRQCDCSFDKATRFLMPDGTEKTTYICCY